MATEYERVTNIYPNPEKVEDPKMRRTGEIAAEMQYPENSERYLEIRKVEALEQIASLLTGIIGGQGISVYDTSRG